VCPCSHVHTSTLCGQHAFLSEIRRSGTYCNYSLELVTLKWGGAVGEEVRRAGEGGVVGQQVDPFGCIAS
jgi:hypothetical protein